MSKYEQGGNPEENGAAESDRHSKLEAVTPAPGKIYGDVGFYTVIAGALIGMVGLAIYLGGGPATVPPRKMIDLAWAGKDVTSLWAAGGCKVVRNSHWFLNLWRTGDGIALIGVSVCSLGAIFGSWAALFPVLAGDSGRLGKRRTIYALLVASVAILLSLTALGVFCR